MGKIVDFVGEKDGGDEDEKRNDGENWGKTEKKETYQVEKDLKVAHGTSKVNLRFGYFSTRC